MRSGVIAVVLLIGLANSAGAQEEDRCTYDTCALRLEQRFGGQRLLRGSGAEVVGKIGFIASDLSEVVGSSESALDWALRSEAQRRRGALVYFGGLVAGAAAITIARAESSTLYWSGLAVALGATSVSTWQFVQSQNSAERAIWWYNRDLAIGQLR